MSEVNDDLDNAPINRFRQMFAESAREHKAEESYLPIKGDVRIHFKGRPLYSSFGMPPTDIVWLIQRFVESSSKANFSLGYARQFYNGSDPTEWVQAIFSKEAGKVSGEENQRFFIDLDLQPFKDIWADQIPSDEPGVIQNVDQLISSSTFQLECLLADIEKVETPNVVVDLTRFKNLAVLKPKGPAQQSLDLGSPG